MWTNESLPGNLLSKEGLVEKSLRPCYQIELLWWWKCSISALFNMVAISPVCLSSVQFSRSVVSDSLQPHELQHARPPCPSPSPRVHSDSRPSSQWCHPAILSSVVPFSSCPQSLPKSESFSMSQLFTWGGQSIGVLDSASVLHPGLVSFRMD